MINLNLKRISGLLLVAVMVFAFSSCTSKKGVDESKKVTILYPNWSEGIAFSYLAKTALEADSFEVELINLEPGLIFGELSKENSKGDVFLDAWLPNTHAPYWADYGDNLVLLGEVFSGGTTGLVVPSYVTINSIEELNANKEKFDSKIIGIGSCAGIHANTLKVIDEYDLDFEQLTSSGPAMVASIQKAVRDEKWIVITGWKPHYKWAKYDLKYLEDPKGIYPTDYVAVVSRRGFEEDKPEAAKFFKNFKLTEAELYSLIDAIDIDGEETGAQKWYLANKELVDSWK